MAHLPDARKRVEGEYGRGAEGRGVFERAGDEVRSWLGDGEAERRRRTDEMRRGRYAGCGPRGYRRSDERIREDIKLVSRYLEFTFFPSLVRLAFGRIKSDDVFFDLIHTMRSRRVALTRGEVVDLADQMYAAGDSVNFPVPKMGHMAVLQGEVAAANLVPEIEGSEPEASYDHELMLVIDEGGKDSIYLHRKLWDEEVSDLRQGRFWGWAKRAHSKYWARLHALRPVGQTED